jgi:hypothetical protein
MKNQKNKGINIDFLESRPLSKMEEAELSLYIKKLKEKASKAKAA